MDSIRFQPRHRSATYDRVCRKIGLRDGQKYAQHPGKYGRSVNASRRRQLRRMPKLALTIAAVSHRILSIRVGLGAGSGAPDFGPLLSNAW